VARPEGLVNIDVPEDDATKAAAALGLTVVALRFIDQMGPVDWTCHPAVFVPLDERWGHVAGWIPSDGGPLWEAVAVGDLTAEHVAGLGGAMAAIRGLPPDQLGRSQFSRGGKWIDQTLDNFADREQRGGGMSAFPTVVWATGKDQLEDCLFFWNLRALRPIRLGDMPMLILPADDIRHWVNFSNEFRSGLHRTGRFSPDVIIGSHSLDKPQLDEIAAFLALQPAEANIESGGGWPLPTHNEPYTYTTTADLDEIGLDIRQYLVFERSYGLDTDFDVQLFRRDTTVRFPSPVKFQTSGRTMVRLSGAPFEALPKRQPIAELVIRNGQWRGNSLQILTMAVTNYLFQINIPSLPEVIETLLGGVTANWQLSGKGAIGAGLQGDKEIAALLENGVAEVIGELTTPRRKHLMKELRDAGLTGEFTPELEELAARWAIRQERIYRSADQLPGGVKAGALNTLERLCDLGFAERGFEIHCGRCQTKSFVLLHDTLDRGRPTCPACHSPQGYAHSGASLRTLYRLDGAIDFASDQGVIPHLLVVAALLQQKSDSWFLPGVDLWFPDEDRKREVDIFGVFSGQVLGGEIKTKAAEFTLEQVQRDIEVSKRLGVDVHLMAAVDKIGEDQRSLVAQLCKDTGVELLVLDKEQLRPGTPR